MDQQASTAPDAPAEERNRTRADVGDLTPRVVLVRPGERGWGVVTVESPPGRDPRFQTEPCRRCPWRRDAPRGAFPAQVFRHSAATCYDLALRTFGCHASDRADPATCAGFLLSGAGNNLQVRLWLARGVPLWRVRLPDGVELYENYRAMAVANGVPPDDPALADCRDDTAVRYLPPAETPLLAPPLQTPSPSTSLPAPRS